MSIKVGKWGFYISLNAFFEDRDPPIVGAHPFLLEDAA